VPTQISLGWKKGPATKGGKKTAALIQRTYAGRHESKAHSHSRWLAFVWRLFICPCVLTQRDPGPEKPSQCSGGQQISANRPDKKGEPFGREGQSQIQAKNGLQTCNIVNGIPPVTAIREY